MTADSNKVSIILHLADISGELDADDLDELTHMLIKDLEDVGVESVTTTSDHDIPQGAKGDPFTIGALLTVVLPVTLPKVMDFLQAWAVRNKGQMIGAKFQHGDRSVEIQYPANMPPEELKKHMEIIKQVVDD
jgi:hypothetical protein